MPNRLVPSPRPRRSARRRRTIAAFGAVRVRMAATTLAALLASAAATSASPHAHGPAPLAPSPADRPSGDAARSVEAWLAFWQAELPADRYRYTADRDRGLVIATALPPDAHARAVAQVQDAHDTAATLLGDPPAAYAVLVGVLDADDADRIRGEHVDAAAAAATGIYVHAERRVLVRDLGRSLRHELAHALHYRDMERRSLRRPDPRWLQEGLATLVEEVEVGEDGSVRLVPGRRLELARRRVASGSQLAWRRLSPEAFRRGGDPPRRSDAERPLVSVRRFLAAGEGGYVDAMAIAAFVLERGRWDAWRSAIAAAAEPNAPADPIAALAVAFDREGEGPRGLADLEREHRRWMLDRAPIAFEPGPEAARLGLLLAEAGPPDGHRIEEVLAGGPAVAAGLRAGDVLVEIAGTPVPGTVELDAVRAQLVPGETVAVTVRRGDERVTGRIVPAPGAGPRSPLGPSRTRI